MNKLTQTLSMTMRAGRLVLGFDPVKDALRKGQAALILTAADLSEKTKKEAAFLAQQTAVPCRAVPLKLDELWYLIGKRAGVLCVTDEGLANKLEQELDFGQQVEEEKE